MLGGKNSRFYFALLYLLILTFLLGCSTSSIDYDHFLKDLHLRLLANV